MNNIITILLNIVFGIINVIKRLGRDQYVAMKDIHFTKIQEYNLFTWPYLILSKYGRFKIKIYLIGCKVPKVINLECFEI